MQPQSELSCSLHTSAPASSFRYLTTRYCRPFSALEQLCSSSTNQLLLFLCSETGEIMKQQSCQHQSRTKNEYNEERLHLFIDGILGHLKTIGERWKSGISFRVDPVRRSDKWAKVLLFSDLQKPELWFKFIPVVAAARDRDMKAESGALRYYITTVIHDWGTGNISRSPLINK